MMMNKGLFAPLLLILVFTAPACCQDAAAELTGLLNEFLAGAGRNDVEVHDKFWGDDLIYTRSAGSRTTKVELMKGVRAAPPPKTDSPATVFTAEDVQIRQYGNVAVVAFRLVATATAKDGAKEISNFLNTGTFVKRNGRWQAVAWQATVVPKPATTN
jgi:ketosteroid isomerase-like protein